MAKKLIGKVSPVFGRSLPNGKPLQKKGYRFAYYVLGHFLSRVRHEVSVSSKHDDEQLGSRMARKVRLRLKMAAWRTV